MRTLLRSLAPAVAVVALLAACGDDADDVAVTEETTRTTEPSTGSTTTSTDPTPGDDQAAIAAARALWDDAGPDPYEMVVERICFCTDEYRGPYVVTVDGGQVTSVAFEDGSPVPDDLAADLPTIDALFDLAAGGAADGTLLAVELDADDGHPELVSLDPLPDAVDDEIAYAVHAVRPAGEGGTGGTAEDALAEAEARWAAEGGDDYTFVVEVSCAECSIAIYDPVRAFVEDGVVVDTAWAEDTNTDALPPGPEELQRFTVEGLFDHIRDGLADGYVIDVDYDPADGHPVDIDDQGIEDETDDELYIDVSELRRS
jgi:hypothetical protein